MELSQDEKDRLIAEEKVRFETRKQMMSEGASGSCGHGGRGACGTGCGNRCGFVKGLIVGLVLCGILSFWCHHRCHGPNDGRCGYGASMTQEAPPPAATKK